MTHAPLNNGGINIKYGTLERIRLICHKNQEPRPRRQKVQAVMLYNPPQKLIGRVAFREMNSKQRSEQVMQTNMRILISCSIFMLLIILASYFILNFSGAWLLLNQK